MSAREQQVRSLIEQDAADWFVANRAGLSARERNEFAAWLRASPVHVEEYLELEIIGRDLREASKASQDSIDELVERVRRQAEMPIRPFWSHLAGGVRTRSPRWPVAVTAMAAMAALGVVSVVALVSWFLRPMPQISTPAGASMLHFETHHGEQQTHRLADNSVVHLNTDTALTVRYSETERLVMLSSGEAEFEVDHESARPFRVLAGPAEVVDLGTRFDVRLWNESTVVTVVEGRVAVGLVARAEGGGSTPSEQTRFVQLGTNQQVAAADGKWPATPVVVDGKRTTAWLHRQLIFENEPLERVVSEFNRYTRKPIEIASPALRTLEVSGVFAIDGGDTLIAFLRSLEGVRVDVTATKILVSQR
jgi:transmembrane sensor